jgi:hypothetical protein
MIMSTTSVGRELHSSISWIKMSVMWYSTFFDPSGLAMSKKEVKSESVMSSLSGISEIKTTDFTVDRESSRQMYC